VTGGAHEDRIRDDDDDDADEHDRPAVVVGRASMNSPATIASLSRHKRPRTTSMVACNLTKVDAEADKADEAFGQAVR
jgi:hypothetical protein